MPEISDPVENLLQDAFESEVRDRPVDERRLTAGTRGRLRRRRRVRHAQFVGAALAVIAAVPVAAQVWPTSSVSTSPARPGPAAPIAPAPSSTPPSAPPSAQTAADVPLPELGAARAAVPAGLELLSDEGPYREEQTPLAGLGVQCDLSSPVPRTLAAQEVQWVDETSEDPDQKGVTVLLTRWAAGDAAAAVDAAVNGSGPCRYAYTVAPLDAVVPGADQAWVAVTDSDATRQGTAFTQVSGLARVGDVVVGVSLQGRVPARSDELTALLTAAVTDLQAAGQS